MEEKRLSVLKRIYNAAMNTSDGFVMSVSIDIFGDERRKICRELEASGYISKLSFHGQDKIQCQLTDKGLQFVQNKSKQELIYSAE